MKKCKWMIFLLFLCWTIQLFAAPCGDVNSDGAIDIVDALMVAQHSVGPDQENFDPDASDVNADGSSDIVDALLIAQYYVGLIPGLPGCGEPTPYPISITYILQAEDAEWSNGTVRETGHIVYVDTDNSTGEWIEWSFELSADSTAVCTFIYANGSSSYRPMDLSVNGSVVSNLYFSSSGAWDAWGGQTIDRVALSAGSDAIRVTATNSGGAPNMDRLEITITGGVIVDPGITPIPRPIHWYETGGFGTQTQAGLGGTVYKVTNLNNSGAGSFRDAVSGSNRLVVFEVGGVIDLDNNDIEVGSNITVAGQTAPYPGIILVGAKLSANGNNTVVSHITVLFGDDTLGVKDTVNIKGDNIVFDHVTAGWAIDEVLQIRGVNNVTLYKCIIAEGLQNNYTYPEYSRGSLINNNCRNLSLIGCLYAHNVMQNPLVDGGEILIANQVNYNWATGYDNPNSNWFDWVVHINNGAEVTFMGNVAIQGPDSVGEIYLDGHHGRDFSAYIEDNIIIDQDGNPLTVYDPDDVELLSSPPLWCDGLEVMSAHESLYEILRTVGPRPGDRDYHNYRLVRTVADGTGKVIDSQDEVGGYPEFTPTQRSLIVPYGTAVRLAWLDALEDEIAVDRHIDLSRLYTMVGSWASDKYAP